MIKKNILLVITLIALVNIVPENINVNYLINNFANFYHTGIDIGGEDKNVPVPVSGEMIFSSNCMNNDMSYGIGNFVVIQDFKNNNRYFFAHLKDGSINTGKIYYNKDDIVGITGNSGFPTTPMVHIDIQNIITKSFLNPLSIINITDTAAPVIEDVYFITEGKKISLTDYSNNKIIKGGKLYVNCYDRINGSDYKLNPYKITAYVDGKEIAAIKFDTMTRHENDFVNQDERSLKEIYSNNTAFDYYLTDFISLPKVIGFKLVVEDYNGNTTEFKRNMIVEF